jgi:hypothetical protein
LNLSKVRNWFQAFALSFNLYRYIELAMIQQQKYGGGLASTSARLYSEHGMGCTS